MYCVNMKQKRGTVREDGMIFWQQKAEKEIWLTAEKFKKLKAYCKKYAKEKYLANSDKRKADAQKWRQENKERYLELSRAWQRAKYRRLHPPKPPLTEEEKSAKIEAKKQKARERAKAYALANPEKVRANALLWAKQNPERVNLRNKLWKQKNPERYKEFQKKYNASVPEKKRKHAAARRCKKKNQSPLLTENQKKTIECFYSQAVRLTERFGFQFEVDHILPIAKGGSHTPSNLQVLPIKINRAKGCKEVFVWQDYQSPLSSDE
jgi:hypothetical protein